MQAKGQSSGQAVIIWNRTTPTILGSLGGNGGVSVFRAIAEVRGTRNPKDRRIKIPFGSICLIISSSRRLTVRQFLGNYIEI